MVLSDIEKIVKKKTCGIEGLIPVTYYIMAS